MISLHKTASPVILSVGDFRKLETAKPDFRDYLLSGPKVETFDIDRPRDLGREIEL